jgi:hypothetical protein
MKGKMLVEGELVEVSDGPVTLPISPPNGGGEGPSQPQPPPPPPAPPPSRVPYFDVGDGEGRPGEIVEISVEAGCASPMSGFHIGGGVGVLPNVERSGYGKFQAVEVSLGKYLTTYLTARGAIENGVEKFWSIFQFVNWEEHSSLPEEWYEYAVGFFSLSQERTIPPIPIPGGTELFTLKIRILPGTPDGQYTLTCKDEYYYTNSRQRRRDFLFTNDQQGISAIETFPGLLRVKA